MSAAGRTCRGDRFEMSFYEIAAELGLESRQHVEFIYSKAIAKLKKTALVEYSTPEPRFTPPVPLPAERERARLQTFAVLRTHVYPDWSPETTVVVSGPVARGEFRGRWFPTRGAAREYWADRAGRIYEEFKVPGRYIFRVRRSA